MIRTAPHTLHFQLTERCNLACPGCYLPARTGPGKSAAEIEARVFAPLAAEGVKFTTLTGGEPLVHAQCAEICAASARHFQETQLVCNGTLLAPDAFFRLAAAGVMLPPYKAASAAYTTSAPRTAVGKRASRSRPATITASNRASAATC